MTVLSARALQLSYRQRQQPQAILQQLDLELASGEVLVALGPSGCGKTSLLNVLAGLQAPDYGQVLIDGKPTEPSDGLRGVVFQDHALLPWLNVEDNLGLGLRLRGMSRSQCRAAVQAWLARVGLQGMARRRIDELSGGQRQRLGLARALAVEPRFLLLDEPFAALDALTRERMQVLLLQLARATGQGLFLITHSVEEALFLATELWLLEGPPLRIRQRLQLPFSRRHGEGASVREITSDPEFSALRQDLLQQMLGHADATDD